MSNPLVNQPCPSCGRYELAYGFDVVDEGPRVIRQVRFRQCGACDWCGPMTPLHSWPTPLGE